MRNVAERQDVSLPYLEQLVPPLVAAGILRSVRGAKGGVLLARHPQEIRLIEVVEALEGSLAPVECLNNPGVCSRSLSCVTRDIWGELESAISGVLSSRTFQDLAERHKAKVGQDMAMYHI